MKKVYLLQTAVLFLFTAFLTTNAYTQMEDCGAHPDDEMMHDEHCAVFALVPYDGATHIAVNNGSWFNPTTWNVLSVPGTNAQVVIDSGLTVTYDAVSEVEIHWVRVIGTLNFSSTVNTKLKVITAVVDPVGHLNIGTAATPVINGVTAKIIFSDQGAIDISDDPFEFGKGLISHGFTNVNGFYKKTICAISKNISAGASNLKLAEIPTGWQVGDQIVLPGTYGTSINDFENNSKFHDEVLTISSIASKTIYFTNNATGGNSLQYEHKFPTGYGLRLYVANVTRNVIFESENYTTIPINQRAHVMLMHNVAQSISNAAFNGLGRSDKNILVTTPVVDEFGNQLSGGENVRGRYSLHLHKAGTNNIGVVPALIKGCAIVDATSWGIVNHQSNANIDDNVVFDFGGAAFVTEDGNELGTFNRNIAIKGKKASLVTDFESRTANFDFGFEGNGFWIQSSNVSYEDNIATSCAGDAYKVFSDDGSLPAEHRIKIPKTNILNSVIAGTDDSIYTAVVPLRKFEGNIAYNCNSALAFWTHLLNNDNIGDFSMLEYDPYTHTIFSVVEDFKFWNLLGAGISIKYSGQVHLKNGLLLGDINNQYQTSDWITGNPMGGFAFISSTVTGQVIYEGLTVKGWKRALVAGRTDDLQSADEAEYNYRNTKVIGGIYNNNLYNIAPEEGTDIYGASEYYKFPKYFEISGSPSFTAITPNVLPTADFAFVFTGGNTIKLNGILSSDSDPFVTTAGQGNGIASYSWNFGDGTTGFGLDPVHTFNTPGTYSVVLTVYDSQGKTSSVTKNIIVTAIDYENILTNSGFETGGLLDFSLTKSTKEFVGIGWLKKGSWSIENGKAAIFLSDKWNRPLIQIVKNDKALRGVIEFSFQAKNIGGGAAGNHLVCEILGVNGEFIDPDVTTESNVQKWNNNDLAFSSTVLLNNEYGMVNYNWQTFTQNVNFGAGYDYIIIKIYSEGLKAGPSDEQGIDNVCLPCNCQIPQHLFEDELTSTHAMLIWDNMGSMNYEVQYKTTVGGSWTTVAVENTFEELTGLLANTSYTWKVKALCDGVWTAYSGEKIFITPSAGTSCTSPNVLSTTLITATKATLNWNTVPGALQYQISYKKLTDLTWTDVITTTNSKLLTGLTANTVYQWKVKTQCAAGWKDYTSIMLFTTLFLKEENEITLVENVNIYPNPVTDMVNVSFTNSRNGILNIRIIDLMGRIVEDKMVNVEDGEVNVELNVEQIPPGVYLLNINDEFKTVGTVKFIKQ